MGRRPKVGGISREPIARPDSAVHPATPARRGETVGPIGPTVFRILARPLPEGGRIALAIVTDQSRRRALTLGQSRPAEAGSGRPRRVLKGGSPDPVNAVETDQKNLSLYL